MLDLDDIADVVASAVKAATAPLIERLDAQAKLIADLEAREMPTTIKGDPGEVDMDAVREIVAELVAPAVLDVQRMADDSALRVVGECGPELVKMIPVPQAPEPIAPDMEAIGLLISEKVSKAVEAIPAAKDGDNGVGLSDALIDKDGNLVITMTDGRTKTLGKVVGEDGEPGKTFTLDDFDIEQTDERTLEFKFLRGDTMHSFEIEFPVPIFKGAFKEGQAYTRGDMTVWGGSLWTATKETSSKPDMPESGWMIAARKGRDGKDAK